jgi:penicillin-binding protein 1C
MQVCRMMDDQPRTGSAKATEALRAMQLEAIRSKDEIIELYLSLAPYGSNLRGVEAASLAYFDKRAKDLSLGEASLLAGLPVMGRSL